MNINNTYTYCSSSGNILKDGEKANYRLHSKGYLTVGGYLAHRLAWYLYYLEWPSGQIDHINQDKKDNRICNLRVVSNKENHKNMPIQKNNKSGIVGVHYAKRKGKWVAYIKVDGKRIHIGSYADIFSACCARRSMEIKLGFHSNHGKLI